MKRILQVIAASIAALMLQSTVSVAPQPKRAVVPATAPLVIVNPSSPGIKMTKGEIKDIFLGKTTTWKDGTPIVIYNLGDKDVHGSFTKEYTGKTGSQYENYWKKIVFTGKGKMPKSQRNEKKMISAISKNAGSIGYVSAAADEAQMKGKDGKAMAVVVNVK